MRFFAVALCIVFALVGCSRLQVAEVDASTGYFPGADKAPIVLKKPVDLDARNELIVVGKSDFLVGQLKNMNYFKEVITIDELEKRIVQANLVDQIPSVRDKLGLSKAARAYRPFLWMHTEGRGEGTAQYVQFVLTDAATLEDYFVTETHLDFMWKGVNDRSNWYPMFNSLIDYVKQNSTIYRKKR